MLTLEEIQDSNDDPRKLTAAEKTTLDYLVKSWNSYLLLEETHPDYTDEFRHAIHICQQLIAVRVARRVNPEIWV